MLAGAALQIVTAADAVRGHLHSHRGEAAGGFGAVVLSFN